MLKDYPDISVNEAQRQAYLKAMGIQVYYPKFTLPGAKPSPRYNSIEEQPVLEKRIEGSSKSSGPEQQTQSDQHAAQKSDVAIEQVSVSDNGLDANIQPEQIITDNNTLKFSLRYYRINDSLAVIDEWPHLMIGNPSEETLTLLRNILSALEINTDECDFSSKDFDWPLMEGLPLTTEPIEAARQALGGFIAMRHDQDGFCNLLVFAGQMEKLLVKKSAKGEQRDYMVEPGGYYFTITSSLQMILSHPKLKREVWDQLQKLRKRLKN